MEWYFFTVFALGSLFVIVIFLASKNGSKAAQLEVLKAELKKQVKEQERAQKITDTVYSLSDADARRRLHNVAHQQR